MEVRFWMHPSGAEAETTCAFLYFIIMLYICQLTFVYINLTCCWLAFSGLILLRMESSIVAESYRMANCWPWRVEYSELFTVIAHSVTFSATTRPQTFMNMTYALLVLVLRWDATCCVWLAAFYAEKLCPLSWYHININNPNHVIIKTSSLSLSTHPLIINPTSMHFYHGERRQLHLTYLFWLMSDDERRLKSINVSWS